jgi:uncharacterized protein (DUF433 family)
VGYNTLEEQKATLTETRYEHVILNEQNVPILAGTTMKVKELAAERLAWGWSPEELVLHHPGLTLGQVCGDIPLNLRCAFPPMN